MISRREFLAAATCAVSIGGNVFAADMLAEAPANAGPKVYGADFTGPLPSSLYLRGRLPPSGSEEATARRIINAAPRSTPLAVMRYFAALRDVNRDGEAAGTPLSSSSTGPPMTTIAATGRRGARPF